MATAGAKDVGCTLVQVRSLELQKEADLDPVYIGLLVLSQDKIIIVDSKANQLRLYSLQDGRLLAVHITKSIPMDICFCNDDETQMALCLNTGQIEILSVKFTNQTTEITGIKTLNLQKDFDGCLGVKYLNRKLVVSGRKEYNICWGVVSITDGHIETYHNICKREKYGVSYLCTNNKDMVFISCYAGDENSVNGVYGYRNSRREFLYQHKDLKSPLGVTMDRKHVYVCNEYPPCIHEMTESGQPLTIHTQGIQPSSRLRAIHWNQQDGLLYVTSYKSYMITRFRPEYSDHQDVLIPVEVLKMDAKSLHIYKEALRGGKEKVYNIRVMVVGQYGVGKTTLTKRLLGKDVDISERKSTEGIDVHIECSQVSLASGEWTAQEKSSEQDYRLQRLARVLNEKQSVNYKTADEKTFEITSQSEKISYSTISDREEELATIPQGNGILNSSDGADEEDNNTDVLYCCSPHSVENIPSASHKIDPMKELIQLLQENTDKLKQDTGKNSPVSVWDFAGQYSFYTTHQTFLTRRAIYLLVSDVSGHITDPVDDDCYFHSEGIMKCRVCEVINIWLNSIHTCAPSPEAGIPPVILVGTHLDKISQKKLPLRVMDLKTKTITSETAEFTLPTTPAPTASAKKEHSKPSSVLGSVQKLFKTQKTKGTVESTTSSSMTGADSPTGAYQPKTQKKWKFWKRSKNKKEINRHEICERYFMDIRTYLSDKPTRFHLVNEDFAIDNTVVDSRLEDLKRKIVEVASQQSYWGEERPTRWIPLEQELMRLKSSGIKVIPFTVLEDLNQAGAVPIVTEELDLFLRFQHDIGTILYFSMEVLKDKIVLDPQWMIDALKSLITAEMFILRNAPAVSDKWFEFKKKGKLSPELIDAIWTKENNPNLHDNKEHILLLMEKLNIIATPKSYIEDGSEIKVENYFLAPCMLVEKTPREVIFPDPQPDMECSSVLCYIFIGKFLPPPIFHRLLATCVSHWPIAKKKSENLIFCGCCVFKLDVHHKLTVFLKDYIIFARVTRIGTTEKTPSSQLCIEVREFITMNLTNMIGYLGQSLQFELSIQCPKSDGFSVDSMIPVAVLQGNVEVPCDFHEDSHAIKSHDVMKFWYQAVEHSDDGSAAVLVSPPPTGDTDRFMRVTYLLVDIGSRVLRRLLSHHTVTPTCTLDQYLAKCRSTINSLLKRKVLHQSQMDILFPPNGGNTNIEDYDVTLLSALFNNMVPSLSQQEEGMIKCLREDRNKLYGHAKSCKMNAIEYQNCRKSISSTLITLSQQCGDPNFENDIAQEIQQIQVAAIPTGSYLDILKTWFNMIEAMEGTLQTIKGSLETAEEVIQTLNSRIKALESKKTVEENGDK
ncbi:hypothetical protein CHS0354_039089 [Potamilus streckersoni]|uniref:non-specific serine/threonine protein kinase n=1 Tax=Potamilus streckersoni TaxID=2493646 RepID=A0AAE0TK64_9BIVA|nr:hypothetical protein CHS0354_039089 [Potamilus streckersoni]